MDADPADRDLLLACLIGASVFARMSPDNKHDLMKMLGGGVESAFASPHLGQYVGFCGDGANDCGALKAAHVGVSLCEAEVRIPLHSSTSSFQGHHNCVSCLSLSPKGLCSCASCPTHRPL